MATELKVPEIGESVTEAEIYKWHKSEGDSVEKDETVAELETDKATFDLPAPAAGTLSKRLKDEGDTAEVGEVIGYIDGEEAKAESKEEDEKEDGEGEQKEASEEAEEDKQTAEDEGQKQKAGKSKAKADGEAEESGETEETAGSEQEQADEAAGDEQEKKEAEEEEEGEPSKVQPRPRLTPTARRVLEEHDLSADEVKGTGPAGRITKEDVLRAAGRKGDEEEEEEEGEIAEAETEAGAKPKASRAPRDGREEETVRMSSIRRRIAESLVDAQQQAALLTTFNEIDMTAVQQLRHEQGDAFKERHGVKLGLMSFFVKAVIDALKQCPELNAEVREDSIVYRNYYDIGIAVATDRGLVVPVIRDADLLSFAEVEETINDFANRARNFDLSPDELQGGTFTITNGGVFGSLLSTPIVKPPQSGVLGMHTIQKRPVAVGEDDRIEVRPMMYVALTYDHRIVDGREAVTCLKRIKETIETPSRMLIEA